MSKEPIGHSDLSWLGIMLTAALLAVYVGLRHDITQLQARVEKLEQHSKP